MRAILKKTVKRIPEFRFRRESGEISTLVLVSVDEIKEATIVGEESKTEVCYIEAARKFSSLNSGFFHGV